jgi:hypothetical protein
MNNKKVYILDSFILDQLFNLFSILFIKYNYAASDLIDDVGARMLVCVQELVLWDQAWCCESTVCGIGPGVGGVGPGVAVCRGWVYIYIYIYIERERERERERDC